MTFKVTELDVVRWGEARGIVQNATAISQATKTLEEVHELLAAITNNDHAEIADAIGDIMVTLVMVCAVLDRDGIPMDLSKCFAGAYEQIKDRRGYLMPDGTFVKQV